MNGLAEVLRVPVLFESKCKTCGIPLIEEGAPAEFCIVCDPETFARTLTELLEGNATGVVDGNDAA